ncbi:hypothetical protein BN133_658 [Cronobacter dublinensis 582]|nr:hypothetical protein BN133_658 [Cronobacter dublinensis 582]
MRHGELQHIAARQQHRALNHVFQLAHVALPFHFAQRVQRFSGNAVDAASQAAGDFKRKRLHQQRNVFRALAQRRQMDREHVQTVIEIASELAVRHHLAQIAVSGGDKPHVGLDDFIAAEPLKLLLLQHAQQLRLEIQRHVAHFIQKQAALVGKLKTPDTLRAGTGKRAALVAEQIALQQACGHRRAVEFHHPPPVAVAQVMDSARDKLFAGAGFTEDQHRTVAFRHHLHLFHHGHHGVRAANDFTKIRRHIVDLLGQRQVFIHQPLFEAMDLLIRQRVIHRDGDTLGNLAQQF